MCDPMDLTWLPQPQPLQLFPAPLYTAWSLMLCTSGPIGVLIAIEKHGYMAAVSDVCGCQR